MGYCFEPKLRSSLRGFSVLKAQVVVLLLLVTVLTGMVRAQAVGTITGQVVDPTGASIKGAHVTITETETGLSRSTTTGDDGHYAVPALRPTEYSITVENAGFKKYTQGGITLLANQTATVNMKLEVGATTQEVTVHENASQVDVSTQTITAVVAQTAVEELPLNGRSVAQLINTVPGASGANPTVVSGQGSLPGSVSPLINGSRNNSTSYLLDGANYNYQYYNTNIPFPFPDAVQEFSVQTANYSARYGGNSGGVVNVVTRSGGNQFHGSLFAFNRNAVFNARNAFAATKDPLKRNQFGGTIGGPVAFRKGEHKTFFFFGYQGTRYRNNASATAVVPNAAELNGDFSALLNANDPNNPRKAVVAIVDPLTGKPFPGNIIPKTRFDPAAMEVLKHLPVGEGDGRINYQNTTSQNVDEYIARVDHQLTANNRLFGRFYWDDIDVAPRYDSSMIINYGLGFHIPVRNLMLQDTHTFSSTLLNSLSFTYSLVPAHKIAAPDSPNPASWGVKNIWQPDVKFIQGLSVASYFSINGGAVGPFITGSTGIADDLSWVKGKHTLSFGFAAQRTTNELGDLFNAPGAFNFTNDAPVKDALASFMLGKMRTFTQGAGEFKNNLNWFFSFYANDSFQATQRLTLNYGLRWEPYTPYEETQGRLEQFRPADARAGVKSTMFPNAPAGLFFKGDKGVPDRGVNGSMKVFAPRVGFAYDLTGKGTRSLRGGFGLFYESQTSAAINNRFANITPFSPQISVTSPVGPFSDPLQGMVNPFPFTYPPSKDTQFPAPVAVVTYDPSGKFMLPLTYQYNLSVQNRLPGDVQLELAYVGSHSIHNKTTVQLNPAQYIPGSNLGTDARRVFQGYGTIQMDGQFGGSNYNSFQVAAKKTATRQLTLNVAYTFAKNLDDFPLTGSNNDVGADGVATLPFYTPNYSRFDYGETGTRRHRLVTSYVLFLPKFAGMNPIAKSILGGWQWSGIVTAQTGGPMTVTAGSDMSQTALNQDRAVIVDRGSAYAKTGLACTGSTIASCSVGWLSRAAFATPATGTFGTPGKGQFTGPGSFTWDMSMAKNFMLSERMKLQFRGEFFNIFNRVNLNNPNTNLNAGAFGTITGAGDPRIGQLSLTLKF